MKYFLHIKLIRPRYDFYRNSIIPFVVKNVLTHWDFNVRKLASQFMGSVCKKHAYLVDEVVDELVSNTIKSAFESLNQNQGIARINQRSNLAAWKSSHTLPASFCFTFG